MPKYLVQCESRHVQYYEFEAENEMEAVKNAKEMVGTVYCNPVKERYYPSVIKRVGIAPEPKKRLYAVIVSSNYALSKDIEAFSKDEARDMLLDMIENGEIDLLKEELISREVDALPY